MLKRVTTIGLAMLVTACGADSPPSSTAASADDAPAASPSRAVVERAIADTAIDTGACLAIAQGAATPNESTCPAFVHDALVEMLATCSDAGGTLTTLGQSSLRSLDVNGDSTRELLFDAAEVAQCEGAWSIFSCGSLGCPVTLMARSGGRWQAIGSLSASDAVGTEVLAASDGQTYRTLRGGCSGDVTCDEWTYYEWTGAGYEAALIEARGHAVTIAPGGLWTLTEDTAVLATPTPNSAVIDRYPANTDVVRIGDARDAPYVYVSPCNACSSGFVAPTALRKFQ